MKNKSTQWLLMKSQYFVWDLAASRRSKTYVWLSLMTSIVASVRYDSFGVSLHRKSSLMSCWISGHSILTLTHLIVHFLSCLSPSRFQLFFIEAPSGNVENARSDFTGKGTALKRIGAYIQQLGETPFSFNRRKFICNKPVLERCLWTPFYKARISWNIQIWLLLWRLLGLLKAILWFFWGLVGISLYVVTLWTRFHQEICRLWGHDRMYHFFDILFNHLFGIGMLFCTSHRLNWGVDWIRLKQT